MSSSLDDVEGRRLEYLYAAPTPSSLVPHGGPRAGGTRVTVHGGGFIPLSSRHLSPISTATGVIARAVISATVPAEALLGLATGRSVLAGIALAGLSLLGSRALWRLALRHYTSASS